MEEKSDVELLKLDRDALASKRKPKLALSIAIAVTVGSAAFVGGMHEAHADGEGECASGFCGTPANNGGGSGSGSGSGSSILVAGLHYP